jgi:Flp pilus assembly secretin CpaC
MPRLSSSLAAIALAAGMAFPALAAETLSVPIDQSAPVSLPPGSMNVMIGNPAIADVNILDPRSAVVLGKAYGVTNLLVLDGRGRTLMDRPIVVSAADTGRITAIRGGATGARVDNYACAARCEHAAAQPGDGAPRVGP